MPNILVACPTHECKAYAFDRWWARVQELTHPHDVFVVDNSPDSNNAAAIMEKGCPAVWDHEIAADIHAMLRITHSMEIIRQRFLKGDWDYWFNLEADVIPPVNVIEQMLEWGRETDWISHAYPARGRNTDDQQGIGCSMLSRRLVTEMDFGSLGDNPPDGGYWNRIRPMRRYRTMELWGYFAVEHLES